MTDLFDYRPPTPAARDTRRDAHRAARETAPELRARCLEVLRHSMGMTADEVAGKLGKSPLSVRPRFTELVQAGEIFQSGERRKNASGRSAVVWKAVNPARMDRRQAA